MTSDSVHVEKKRQHRKRRNRHPQEPRIPFWLAMVFVLVFLVWTLQYAIQWITDTFFSPSP